MEDIKLILNDIINRLDRIEERIIHLEQKQEEIKESTHNMDSHIQFIENVYDNVKKPLSYVTHKINNFILTALKYPLQRKFLDYLLR